MEDLDSYVGAYDKDFRYLADNVGVLGAYANELIKACKKRDKIDLCSLGIGYEVVSRRIFESLGSRLNRYEIVEGSAIILERFKESVSDHNHINLVHSFFEDYSPSIGFDVIEMGFVLEHVEDPKSIVKKFAEFLNPGGVIVAAVPNARSLNRILGYRAGLLENMYALSEWDIALGHRRYFDSVSFSNLFLENGMTVVRTNGLMLKPFSSSQLEQLDLPQKVWQVLYDAGDLAPEYAYGLYLEAVL